MLFKEKTNDQIRRALCWTRADSMAEFSYRRMYDIADCNDQHSTSEFSLVRSCSATHRLSEEMIWKFSTHRRVHQIWTFSIRNPFENFISQSIDILHDSALKITSDLHNCENESIWRRCLFQSKCIHYVRIWITSSKESISH